MKLYTVSKDGETLITLSDRELTIKLLALCAAEGGDMSVHIIPSTLDKDTPAAESVEDTWQLALESDAETYLDAAAQVRSHLNELDPVKLELVH